MTIHEDLDSRIKKIEERNKQVELNKSWETSMSRRILISILTYIVVSMFFVVSRVERPFLNAIVPTIGFLLSTLSLRIFKDIWIRRHK